MKLEPKERLIKLEGSNDMVRWTWVRFKQTDHVVKIISRKRKFRYWRVDIESQP